MNAQKLKDVLSQRILNIDDVEILNTIKELTDDSARVYKLNREEKSMIAEAQEDYRSSKVQSNEEVSAEIDSWLKEE